MDELTDDVRRALGLAVQILEELPVKLRPDSNIDEMRDLLEGKSSGRDGMLIIQAVATALACRTHQIISRGNDDPEITGQLLNTRLAEFTALFELVRQVDARTFAIFYVEACGRSVGR